MNASFFNEWMNKNKSSIKESLFILRLTGKSPLAIMGISIVSFFILVALFAPLIAPYGPEERIWNEAYKQPSTKHLFGTDNMGGDILSCLVWGTRITFRIAFTACSIIVVVGVTLGCISSFCGGWTDEIIMRMADAVISIPSIILAMVSASLLGRSLDMMIVAISLVSWPVYARLARGQVLSVKQNYYIEAAHSLGASDRRIITQHILPNIMTPVIVNVTMDVGGIILVVASLSFLGFGTPPGMPEWGRIIAEGQRYAFVYPWMFLFPGFTILTFALGWNLLGDALRDALDPRLRR